MRALAVATAGIAAWMLAGGSLPMLPRTRPCLRPSALPAVALAATAAFGVVLGLSGDPVIAGAVALLAAGFPPAIDASRRRARTERVADRWPDFLAAVRGELATGSSVPEATMRAGRRLGDDFADLAAQVSSVLSAGGTFSEGVAAVRRSWADPLADRVMTTLAAAAVTGGDRVSSILGALAASVSAELRLRRAHDAALTQQRLTAAVALVAPWVLLILTTATNPQAADALSSETGRLIVGGGLGATGLGYLLARRAAHLSRTPRIFE